MSSIRGRFTRLTNWESRKRYGTCQRKVGIGGRLPGASQQTEKESWGGKEWPKPRTTSLTFLRRSMLWASPCLKERRRGLKGSIPVLVLSDELVTGLFLHIYASTFFPSPTIEISGCFPPRWRRISAAPIVYFILSQHKNYTTGLAFSASSHGGSHSMNSILDRLFCIFRCLASRRAPGSASHQLRQICTHV
jgi:hypothetical protein